MQEKNALDVDFCEKKKWKQIKFGLMQERIGSSGGVCGVVLKAIEDNCWVTVSYGIIVG